MKPQCKFRIQILENNLLKVSTIDNENNEKIVQLEENLNEYTMTLQSFNDQTKQTDTIYFMNDLISNPINKRYYKIELVQGKDSLMLAEDIFAFFVNKFKEIVECYYVIRGIYLDISVDNYYVIKRIKKALKTVGMENIVINGNNNDYEEEIDSLKNILKRNENITEYIETEDDTTELEDRDKTVVCKNIPIMDDSDEDNFYVPPENVGLITIEINEDDDISSIGNSSSLKTSTSVNINEKNDNINVNNSNHQNIQNIQNNQNENSDETIEDNNSNLNNQKENEMKEIKEIPNNKINNQSPQLSQISKTSSNNNQNHSGINQFTLSAAISSITSSNISNTSNNSNQTEINTSKSNNQSKSNNENDSSSEEYIDLTIYDHKPVHNEIKEQKQISTHIDSNGISNVSEKSNQIINNQTVSKNIQPQHEIIEIDKEETDETNEMKNQQMVMTQQSKLNIQNNQQKDKDDKSQTNEQKQIDEVKQNLIQICKTFEINKRTHLDKRTLFITSKYFETIDDFKHLEMTCKKYRGIIEMFHYNPIPITGYLFSLFQNITELHIYQKENENLIPKRIKKVISWKQLSIKSCLLAKKDAGIPIEFKNVFMEKTDREYYENKWKKENQIQHQLTNTKDLFTYVNKIIPIHSLGHSCFGDCSDLETVIIPSTVKYIHPTCFNNCSNLKEIEITLNQHIHLIENKLFNVTSSSIETIKLPLSVTKINGIEKKEPTSLNVPLYNESNTTHFLSQFCKLNQMALSQPYSLKSILNPALYLTLETIVYNCSFQTFSNSYISGIKNLKKIVFLSNIDVIASQSFKDLKMLETIQFLSTVKEFKSCAFYGIRNLKELTIPNSVTAIGSRCFMECTNLKSIQWPTGLTKIERATFYRCYNLTQIENINHIKMLDDFCFSSNSKLKDIPSDWKRKFPNAFQAYTLGLSQEQFIEKHSKKKIGKLLFDSYESPIEKGNCSLLKAILGKQNITFIIEVPQNKFGIFIPKQINYFVRKIVKPEDNMFIFSFSSQSKKSKQLKYPLKTEMQNPVGLFNESDDELITLGNTFFLYKSDSEIESFCLKNDLCFDIDSSQDSPFASDDLPFVLNVKRICVFQMY